MRQVEPAADAVDEDSNTRVRQDRESYVSRAHKAGKARTWSICLSVVEAASRAEEVPPPLQPHSNERP